MRLAIVRAVILLGLFLLIGASKPEDRIQIRLDSLQEALDARRANRPVPAPFASILAGYSFHWDIEMGGHLRLIVISRNLGGDLFAFNSGGTLSARKETQEITGLQLFDFDEDGRAEIILDEVDGRGTGILLRNFHIYRLGDHAIEHLWEGTSYHRKMLPDGKDGSPAIDSLRAYIRCEPSGAGMKEARLLQIIERPGEGRATAVSRHAYAFSEGRFRSIAWPER